jgi:hypothetical protein
MVNDDCNRPIRRKPIFLRCPEELRTRLVDRARESERSLTAEVVYRLRRSLQTADEAAA